MQSPGLGPPEDPKQPTLLVSLKPLPDKDWEKDQMDFRVAQTAELQVFNMLKSLFFTEFCVA